jgi:thiol-disulfide isomerase/thioredoxin
MKKIFFTLFLIILFTSSNKSYALTPESGLWKFSLKTPHTEVPVIIDLNFKSQNAQGTILNGKENIPLQNIKIQPGKIVIPLQTYEITMELQIKGPRILEGQWIRHNKNPKIILPIKGVYGIGERHQYKKSSFQKIDGKWQMDITDESGKSSSGILIIEQNGQKLNGSLLTETGDFRFMEGYISGNSFELSSFDGMFNYNFKGKIFENNLEASLLSTYKLILKGIKNENATLKDPYSLTQFQGKLDFNFPDLSGKMTSLNLFKNKPVIIQIFGSWCPNCIDEMNFLIPWYQDQKNKDIEIIALAFERSLNQKLAKAQLLKVQNKFQVPYPLLLAGSTAEDKPESLIKGLKNFVSFPTMIFLNKRHEILKIHAGFSGPSTGEYFIKWQQEFRNNVDLILK